MITEENKNYIDLTKLESVFSKGDSWIAACPACRHEGRDKTGNHLRVWSNGAFSCIIDDSKDHNRAILSLAGTQMVEGEVIFRKPEPKIEVSKKWPLDILKGLIRNNDYWNNRGISSETIDYFQCGIALKGQMASRSVLPIFNKDKTHVIGFTGRALRPDMKPKWKHLGDKSDFIFPYIQKERYRKILLVEAPACIFKMWDFQIKNTKCLFGVTASAAILKYLIETNPDEILIGTNNELDFKNKGVGNKAAIKLENQLLQFFSKEKIKIALPPAKDFADSTDEQIKQYIKDWNLL